MALETNIRNNKGDGLIILNDREEAECARFQPILNATGFEIPVTTLTAIAKKVAEQKFFEVKPSDYMPVRVGENAWASQILTYQQFSIGGNFANGVLNTGGNNSRLASSNTAIQSIVNPVRTWGEQVEWALPELQMAARAGNWNIVEAKERARKTVWDLGIQQIAFLGDASLGIVGLINQAGVTVNASVITKYISTMTYTEFAAFVQTILGTYRANVNYTAWPDTFMIPELDYDGLMVPVSPQFPNTTMLDYLLQAFRRATRNENFQILPNHYADTSGNSLGYNSYTLYRRDESSLVMDLPVPYTTTQANTTNGFQWQNVAYGQFTGPQAIRPAEMLYFRF